MTTNNTCTACNGSGKGNGPQGYCDSCRGAGTKDGSSGIFDKFGRPTGCILCHGKGMRYQLGRQLSTLYGGNKQYAVAEVACDHYTSKGLVGCNECNGEGYFIYVHDYHGAQGRYTIRCSCVKVPPNFSLNAVPGGVLPPPKVTPRPVSPPLKDDPRKKVKPAEKCKHCRGNGMVMSKDGEEELCIACNGTGVEYEHKDYEEREKATAKRVKPAKRFKRDE